MNNIPSHIFRHYDIRGIAGIELTEEAVYRIARTFGAMARAKGETCVITACDARLSAATLYPALKRGLLESSLDVTDIGQVPTPVLYFAAATSACANGVMLTASHNPKEYNGLKMVLQGKNLTPIELQDLAQTVNKTTLTTHSAGQLTQRDFLPLYIDTIAQQLKIGKRLKIVIDCANAIPAIAAPTLFKRLGFEVIELYTELDGNFPNHSPDPTQPKNLTDLITAVKAHQADLGLGFDGDGDRLGVVTNLGEVIFADRLLMLLAQDVLSRHPGATIVYDVKCSHLLKQVITSAGGKPVMGKTGHSLIKALMRSENALLAGEMSGHIFFKENWYGFDDGLYTAARLLSLLSHAPDVNAVFAALPHCYSTAELSLPVAEQDKAALMQALIARLQKEPGEVCLLDGIRIDFQDAWGLVRPSNTTPSLVLRFEGSSVESLARIQGLFKSHLSAIEPGRILPF
ncbi:MAG: phosphomannomutase/phosphoglucomutase [Gammaproteobacteria bacterium]|nr:phosphomannomutase/phosphoglucomutase [Gammaproteobacteria bacterium]